MSDLLKAEAELNTNIEALSEAINQWYVQNHPATASTDRLKTLAGLHRARASARVELRAVLDSIDAKKL